ncbi:hypothetical protein D918_09911 [Trichuris suis]|nr:hypothetical protein D918_09911 [Trichuris suis]
MLILILCLRLFAEEGDNYEEFLHKSQAFLNPCSADNLLKYFDIEYYVNSFDPMLRERLDAYQIKEGIPLRQAITNELEVHGPPPVEPWSDLKRHHDQPLVRRGNQFPSRAGYVRNADRYARWTERAQLNGLNRSSVVNRGKSTTSIRSGDASETSSRSDTVRKDDQQSVNRKRIALAQQLNEMENFISKLKAKASSNT